MSITAFLKKYSSHKELRSVAIYTFSNFFNKGVSFLLLFYFTRVLSESDYGMLSLFSNSILFLMPFISMGILQSVKSDFFKMDKSDFRSFFSTILLLPIIITVLSIALLFLLKEPLTAWLHFPAVFIWVIPVVSLFAFLNEQLFILLRNNEKPIAYFVLSSGRLLIEFGLAILLISCFDFNWLGRMSGYFVSYFVMALYAFYYFNKNSYIFGKLKMHYVREELLYSVPIIVLQLSFFSMGASAVYWLQYFTNDLAEVGIFNIAVTFGSIVNVFCSALLQYVQPKIYSLLSEEKINANAIKKQFWMYGGLLLLFTILIIAAVPLAYKLYMKASYLTGMKYYYFFCLGQFFWGIAFFFCSFLLYYKLKKKLLFFSTSAILISTLCNYFFIKEGGSMGGALASMCSYFIVMVIAFVLVRKQILPILQSKNS